MEEDLFLIEVPILKCMEQMDLELSWKEHYFWHCPKRKVKFDLLLVNQPKCQLYLVYGTWW